MKLKNCFRVNYDYFYQLLHKINKREGCSEGTWYFHNYIANYKPALIGWENSTLFLYSHIVTSPSAQYE